MFEHASVSGIGVGDASFLHSLNTFISDLASAKCLIVLTILL